MPNWRNPVKKLILILTAQLLLITTPAQALDCDVVKEKIGFDDAIWFISGWGNSGQNSIEQVGLRANYIGKFFSIVLERARDKSVRNCINEIVHNLKDTLAAKLRDDFISNSLYVGYTFGLAPGAEDYVGSLYNDGLTSNERMTQSADKILSELEPPIAGGNQVIGGLTGLYSDRRTNPPSGRTATAPSVGFSPEYDRCSSGRPSLTMQLTVDQMFGAGSAETFGNRITEVIIYGDLANNADVNAISNQILSQMGGRAMQSRYYLWSRCGEVHVSESHPSLTAPICGCTADGQGRSVASDQSNAPVDATSAGSDLWKRCCAVGAHYLEMDTEFAAQCNKLVGGDFVRWSYATGDRENCQRILYPERYR